MAHGDAAARPPRAPGAALPIDTVPARMRNDSMPRPRICLNMIVRNEAAIVLRALRSALGTVDCCVICDTGSTDATVALVRSFCAAHGLACEVHEFAFVDFGQARNEALARARRSALAFDYLLLFDADMELVVERADALCGLAADGASVRQVSGTLAYDNVRVLRRSADARYVGATHEALAVAGEVVRLDGLHFVDHADGGNRPEKLARDERLLRAALARDAGDARAMFYLAQTLREAGRPLEAADWYAARIAAGGWDEERWYARYQWAVCQLAAGNEAAFAAACLEAYAERPWRAEPLMRLARHHADRGRHDAALLLFEQAARMPPPAADRLFVERDACGDAVREAIAISGYYSALAARRDAGRRACEALSVDPHVAPRARHVARANLRFYAQPVAALYPGARVAAIPVTLPEPLAPTNPSLVRDEDGYRGVVRGVNYRLESGRYRVLDDDGCVRTRNFLVRLTDDFAVADVREMRDAAPLWRDPVARIRGFEDCRLFRWNGSWWCSATARDLAPEGIATMCLLRLDADGDVVAAHALRGYGDDLHQKNWMPTVDARLRFVYSLGPTIVLDATAADGTFVVETGTDPGVAIDHWRGGSPLLRWGSGHLALVHEATDTGTGRRYTHRFVELDARYLPVAASDAFHFGVADVEFAAGLTTGADGDTLVASFGAADRTAMLAVFAAGEVRASLRPLVVRDAASGAREA